MNKDDRSLDDIHFCDVAPALEFVCWFIVLLSPILRWINGPAVTHDQFVVQVAIFSLALFGSVALRLYQIITK